MNRSPLPPEPADLDRVLTQFFQAQLPQRWPDAPVPVDVRPSARAANHGWHTRLTLAASVAALCGLGFTLSYGPGKNAPTDPNGGLLDKGTADGNKLNKHIHPDNRPLLPMK